MKDNRLTNQITIKRLEEMQAHCDEGGKFTHENAVELLNHAFAMIVTEANMRNALDFYQYPSDYVAPFTGGLGKLYFDCGTKAREALSCE